MRLIDQLGQALEADRVAVDLDLDLLDCVFDGGDHSGHCRDRAAFADPLFLSGLIGV